MLLVHLLIIAMLSGTGLSIANLTEVLSQYPACTTKCFATELTIAQCPLSDLPNCLCTNETVQYNIAYCVNQSCNLTEQIVSTIVTQNEVCNGVPKPSRSSDVRWTSIILAAITFPIVALRLASRILIQQQVWWDDWAIIAATLCMIPNAFSPIYMSYHGFGLHVWDVSLLDQPLLLKWFYISQIFYILIQNLAKFSIVLLYLRIFPDPQFRRIVKVTFAFMICHALAFLFAVLFQCTPVEAVWNPQVSGQCLNIEALVFAGAGFSIIEDFVVMLLPISELRTLNLSVRKRIALCFMFALGSFACVTSMVRLKFLVARGRSDSTGSIDTTWSDVDVVIWSQLETYVAVICACLIYIRPLLKKLLPSLFPDTGPQNSGQNAVPTWGQKVSSRLRIGNVASGLRGEDEETLRRNDAKDSVTDSTFETTGSTFELRER